MKVFKKLVRKFAHKIEFKMFKKHCPICGYKGVFIEFNKRKKVQCPKCLSLERHRFFYFVYKDEIFNTKENLKILHFGPERCFSHIITQNKNLDYLPADIDPDNYKQIKNIKKMDITCIDVPDNSIDIVITNHVLEHIPDDIKAISEIYRVLKENGKAFISVPFSKDLEKTFEDKSVITDEERKIKYGQCDHVRLYGKDFPQRLQSAGFFVEALRSSQILSVKDIKKYVAKDIIDTIFICKKNFK